MNKTLMAPRASLWLRSRLCGTLAALAILGLPAGAALAQSGESIATQNARVNYVKSKAAKVHYTKKFDLSGLPSYQPRQQVSGKLRIWGLNYISDGMVAGYWEEEFRKHHPGVEFEWYTPTALVAVPGMITNNADLAATRPPTFDELLTFQRVKGHLPLQVEMVTGAYNVSGWAPAIAIFVHKDNPISKLTLQQLDGIFGAERTGGWDGLEWRTEVARGPEKNIRTWGDLGLTGEWKDKPINIYGGNHRRHENLVFEKKVFNGGTKWNEKMREYANHANPDGTLNIALDAAMKDLSKDRYGIGYNAKQWQTPQLKSLALAVNDAGPYVDVSLESVQGRTYPLYSQEYWLVDRKPGQPVDPKVAEFVRYVLSREGQEAVIRDGKFLPLTAEVAAKNRKLLD